VSREFYLITKTRVAIEKRNSDAMYDVENLDWMNYSTTSEVGSTSCWAEFLRALGGLSPYSSL
jgi:hypothetical protein